METRFAPWVETLHRSHDRLTALVQPLGADKVVGPSYDDGWSIAQVVSHLASQSEIFGLFLDAGLHGTPPPGPEDFHPIWDAWNARSPESQAADGLEADAKLLGRFESLDAGEVETLCLQAFGRELDATGLARMRVGEHALHTWDVAVALDPAATLAPDAARLLVDTLGPLVDRASRPDGVERRVQLVTSEPERVFTLVTGDRVTLSAAERDPALPEIRLPAEALIRLVYGRLDPTHTPRLGADGVDLDQLRALFPGF